MAVENDDKGGDKDKDKGTAGDKDNKTGGSSTPDTSAADKARAEALATENARLSKERDDAKAATKILEDEKAARTAKELEEQGKFKELADAANKEKDKATTEAAEVKSTAEKRIITSEIRLALIGAGATDPDIHVMVDRSTLKLEGDNVAGLKEAIEKFKTDKPHFFGKTEEKKEDKKDGNTGAGGTQPKGKEGSGDTPDVRKMKPDEYAAYRRKYITDAGGAAGRRALRSRRG